VVARALHVQIWSLIPSRTLNKAQANLVPRAVRYNRNKQFVSGKPCVCIFTENKYILFLVPENLPEKNDYENGEKCDQNVTKPCEKVGQNGSIYLLAHKDFPLGFAF